MVTESGKECDESGCGFGLANREELARTHNCYRDDEGWPTRSSMRVRFIGDVNYMTKRVHTKIILPGRLYDERELVVGRDGQHMEGGL